MLLRERGVDALDVDTHAKQHAVVRDLAPKLLKAGAEDIIEYPLNKVI